MTGLVSEIVDWIRPAFGVAGYAIVPGAMFLESLVLVGVVVPGDVLLAVSGMYVARGELSAVPVVALAVAGALIGEIAGYAIGRRYGRPAIERLPFSNRIGRQVDRTTDAIRDHAGKTLLLGRFATGIVPFAAGMAKVRFTTFLAITAPLLVVWATGVMLLGVLVGNNIELIDRILSAVGWFVVGAATIGIGGWWAWRRWHEQ